MPTVQSNGVNIAFEEAGHGDPLLLVMGFSGQLVDWPEGFVELLVAAGFRVIRYDNRDAGLSSATPGAPPSMRSSAAAALVKRGSKAAYTIEDMADDGVGLLDALDIDSAHIVGMSMGGMIAQAIAIHHGQRVRSLTSIMSNTGDLRHGRSDPRLLLKLVALMRKTPSAAAAPEVLTRAFALFAGADWDQAEARTRFERSVARSYRPKGSAHQAAAMAASPDRTRALARVAAPTLAIHGLEDTLVLPSGGVATAKAVPGSRLLLFPEMGHNLARSRWPEIVRAIVGNADRAQSAAGSSSPPVTTNVKR